MMKQSQSYKTFTVFNVTFLLLVVFLTLYPFVNIIAQSFSSQEAITAGKVNLFPVGFNTVTYAAVASDPMFWRNYGNTVLYTVVATAISMVLTTCYAYVLSKKHIKGRSLLIGVAVFTMFFNGGLIPNYILISTLGLKNSIWAVVLPNAISVFNLLVMKSFFEGMPNELEEAAAIDGLNQVQTFLRVVLPLSKAVLATMILFYAVANWNAWFGAFLYMDKKELFPVTIYLRNLIAGTSGVHDVGASVDNETQIAANIKAVTMVLTVLPILTIYPFVQKYFVSGVMLGSVKG
ncbi:carbohydrate ABC transporter permease [Propioniciclava coleopterorum]|uniref:Carbohydrate ABC transporter permease n=2 Tax=Propioniciclava coleopterorum TaxID=2714937 RepID=A0A6G7YBD9_9ACTN|nr:carbohydrate ABC transporter permease [Propioniciclava coleopterorum]